MEYRFTGPAPFVSTQEFHNDRERAPHLEQHEHRGRLLAAAEAANELASPDTNTLVDLGCGDGGLLSQLKGYRAWGYDFQPSNLAAIEDRGVDIRFADFIAEFETIELADVVVMTECLEHMDDPHTFLKRVFNETLVKYFVASSPATENMQAHDSLHVWGWDFDGYKALFEQAGWQVLRQQPVDRFQLLVAKRSE